MHAARCLFVACTLYIVQWRVVHAPVYVCMRVCVCVRALSTSFCRGEAATIVLHILPFVRQRRLPLRILRCDACDSDVRTHTQRQQPLREHVRTRQSCQCVWKHHCIASPYGKIQIELILTYQTHRHALFVCIELYSIHPSIYIYVVLLFRGLLSKAWFWKFQPLLIFSKYGQEKFFSVRLCLCEMLVSAWASLSFPLSLSPSLLVSERCCMCICHGRTKFLCVFVCHQHIIR